MHRRPFTELESIFGGAMRPRVPIDAALLFAACAGAGPSSSLGEGGPITTTAPMPLLSLTAPAFASGSIGAFTGPDKAKVLSTLFAILRGDTV